MAKRRSQQNLRLLMRISIAAALVFVGYLIFLWSRVKEPTHIRYKEFGIAIPTQYEIHGIDVSRYQSTIAWGEVQRMNVRNIRLGFAFIKATEGTNLTDPYFKRNWKKAKEAGVVRGAYHFFNPRRDGKSQADYFAKQVRLESGDLPPVLDIERGWNVPVQQLQAELRKWLDAMEAAYGVKPIIYTYVTFYERYLKGSFDDYPLWVAHYHQPNNPRIARRWDFWQHSEQGRVNGITSKVDFNVFNGDSAAFKALLVP